MEGLNDEINSRCEIPENSVPIFSLDILSYFDDKGEMRYSYKIQGEAKVSALVSVLELVKHQFIMENFAANENDE